MSWRKQSRKAAMNPYTHIYGAAQFIECCLGNEKLINDFEENYRVGNFGRDSGIKRQLYFACCRAH
jgi:hypothetical protein